jgi:hypothetical protein
VDVEHPHTVEPWLVLPRVNAIDRTDIDTGTVLGADTRFTDYVRHLTLSPRLTDFAQPLPGCPRSGSDCPSAFCTSP